MPGDCGQCPGTLLGCQEIPLIAELCQTMPENRRKAFQDEEFRGLALIEWSLPAPR